MDKRTISDTIAVGKDPYGAALSPDGQFVYAGNQGDNTVSVIAALLAGTARSNPDEPVWCTTVL